MDFAALGRLRRWGARAAEGLGGAWLLRQAWLHPRGWGLAGGLLGLALAALLISGLGQAWARRGRIQCLLTEQGLCGPYFGGLWWRFGWAEVQRVGWEQDQDGRRGLVLHFPGIWRHRIEILRAPLQAALLEEIKRRVPPERWSGGPDEALDSEPLLKMA
ncbi:MAG TPA: hypothetical protein VK842_04335 [bacterium]|nr:hypothetical protein [bacterium]